MARRRMIDPKFWTDETIQIHLTAFERLFYIGTWSLADDFGRIIAHDALLKSQILPSEGRCSATRVRQMIDKFARLGLVHVYKDGNGNSYIHHPKWFKYQRVDKPQPSKLPPCFCEQGGNDPKNNSKNDSKNDSRNDSGVKEVKGSKEKNPRRGLKENQNENIEKIQILFKKRFEKELSIPQVQVLAHGGGNGRVYGFGGDYEALSLAIGDIPADAKSPVDYVFRMADDGRSVEKYRKRVREKVEAKEKALVDF